MAYTSTSIKWLSTKNTLFSYDFYPIFIAQISSHQMALIIFWAKAICCGLILLILIIKDRVSYMWKPSDSDQLLWTVLICFNKFRYVSICFNTFKYVFNTFWYVWISFNMCEYVVIHLNIFKYVLIFAASPAPQNKTDKGTWSPRAVLGHEHPF